MKKLLVGLFKSEEGQGMAEYGLIIALVAIALIGGLGILATSLDGIFTTTGDTLDGATP
jgi:pilus assembly protein Flp/PilA